jgi:hypothetical protein
MDSSFVPLFALYGGGMGLVMLALCLRQLRFGLRDVGIGGRFFRGAATLVAGWSGIWLCTTGVVALVYSVTNTLGHIGLLIVIPALVFVALPLYRGTTRLMFHGRRVLAADARVTLERDTRAPIIYLRAFGADKTQGQMLDTSGAFLGTLEERIMRALGKYGPVVALGQPGEELPPLGAARLYVSDNHYWREEVTRLLAVARLVVVRPATSEAVLWEVCEAANTVNTARLAFYVYGLAGEEWQAFVEAVADKDCLPVRLPMQLDPETILVYFRHEPQYVFRPLNPNGRIRPYSPGRQLVRPLFEP